MISQEKGFDSIESMNSLWTGWRKGFSRQNLRELLEWSVGRFCCKNWRDLEQGLTCISQIKLIAMHMGLSGVT